jgi:hypothetical protein
MHCRFENKRICKGMQFDRLENIAVSDSSQSLVNMIFLFFLKYLNWSCFISVRCLHSINYKKRQQNCTRMQNNIITFDNWNCLGFYVEDTICEMGHDSNLKFNTCKPQKDYFYSVFFSLIFLWFTRLCLFCPLFLFLKFTCVEFQVRIMPAA